jgi:hypothetical protein
MFSELQITYIMKKTINRNATVKQIKTKGWRESRKISEKTTHYIQRNNDMNQK